MSDRNSIGWQTRKQCVSMWDLSFSSLWILRSHSSVVRCLVILQTGTNGFEEAAASIFRILSCCKVWHPKGCDLNARVTCSQSITTVGNIHQGNKMENKKIRSYRQTLGHTQRTHKLSAAWEGWSKEHVSKEGSRWGVEINYTDTF
jgi:hypothetical protein